MVVENGAYAVTGAMKAFPNQHALQMHGIRIIGAIGCFGTFECLQALLAAKGDVCLVEAMRAHPKQAAVQEAGCGALPDVAMRDHAPVLRSRPYMSLWQRTRGPAAQPPKL